MAFSSFKVVGTLACAVAMFGAERAAHADGSARNPAAAEALYEKARQLARAGRYDEACPKFRESYDLDPGGGTLLNLADCYEKQGKLATAWSTFKEAQVMAQRDGRQDRVDFASQHISALEPRLSRVTVNVSEPARVPGLSVRLDDAALGPAAWGVGVPVDPGVHRLQAQAPGHEPYTTTIEAGASGGSQVVEVPELAASAANTPAAAPPTPAGPAAPAPAHSGSSSQKTLGWVTAGVGVAALGVGSYFGLRAFSRWKDRKDACTSGCTADAKQAGDDASSAATLSNIGFGVGIVAVGVGLYLALSAPSSSEREAARGLKVAPLVGVGPRGLSATGLSVRQAW